MVLTYVWWSLTIIFFIWKDGFRDCNQSIAALRRLRQDMFLFSSLLPHILFRFIYAHGTIKSGNNGMGRFSGVESNMAVFFLPLRSIRPLYSSVNPFPPRYDGRPLDFVNACDWTISEVSPPGLRSATIVVT